MRKQFVEPGQVFTRLTVKCELPGIPRLIECICQCGTSVSLPIDSLVSGNSKSCGCLVTDTTAARNRAAQRHGMRSHPLYDTWRTMLRRCEDRRVQSYPMYGGRGIAVAPEWHDVTAFIAWIEANLGPRPDGMSLDRTNNDGNYEPGNLRWATSVQQANNRRVRKAPKGKRRKPPPAPLAKPCSSTAPPPALARVPLPGKGPSARNGVRQSLINEYPHRMPDGDHR